jgi:chromosome segregation ATPase
LKKIGQAEMYVTKIKDLTDQKQRLSDDREAIQKRLQQVEESLAEIKKYQDIEKELEQVKKKKEIISVMINKEHINFDKLKSQEKEIDKFNSILTESVKVGIRPYQELHLMEKIFLEMEKALKKKENEVLLMQSKLESVENEILQIKNNLEKENMQQREFKVQLQLEKDKSKILHKNREAIEKDNISRFDGKNDKKTERLALLQKNIKEGNEHIKCDNPTIKKAIAERNTLAETLNQKRQTIEDYQKTFLLSAESQDRTSEERYFEMGRVFEDHIAVIKDYISEDGVSISYYDKLIKDGLIYESAKNLLYKEYIKGKYDKEKERVLKELKEEINNQKAKENESQLKFNEINKGIASEEKRLSTKQQERQILQENLATIRLEMEECAAKINDQKKSKKELSDEIKDRALPETEVVRIKTRLPANSNEEITELGE